MRHLLNQILINNFIERGYDLNDSLTVQRLRQLHSSDQDVLRLLDDIESAQTLKMSFDDLVQRQTHSHITSKKEYLKTLVGSLGLQIELEPQSDDIFTSKFEQLSKDNPNAWR